MWTALNYPVLFIVLLVVFSALVIWLMPKLWRAIKTIFAKIRGWFTGSRSDTSGPTVDDEQEVKKLK